MAYAKLVPVRCPNAGANFLDGAVALELTVAMAMAMAMPASGGKIAAALGAAEKQNFSISLQLFLIFLEYMRRTVNSSAEFDVCVRSI
jgi:hypothetical protein